MSYILFMTNEEKNLIDLYADQAFHGNFIRQEIPVCQCGKIYDEKELYNAPGVFLKRSMYSERHLHLLNLCALFANGEYQRISTY